MENNLIDSEILMIFGIFVISFILLNVLFKFVSMPRLVKRLLIIVFVVGNGFLVYNYIDKNEEHVLKDDVSKYVVGQVEFVSSSLNRINVYCRNTNIKDGKYDAKVVVKIHGNTGIYTKEDGISKRISIKDLEIGDMVTIYCNSNSSLAGEKPEIDANRVIKSNSE